MLTKNKSFKMLILLIIFSLGESVYSASDMQSPPIHPSQQPPVHPGK